MSETLNEAMMAIICNYCLYIDTGLLHLSLFLKLICISSNYFFECLGYKILHAISDAFTSTRYFVGYIYLYVYVLGQCPDGADEDSILLQVYDRREMSTTVDELHKLVVDFLKETSKRIDEDMSVLHNEDEISAAVDSIFPRTGFLCWMNLSDVEKATQMLELSNIVPGIRAYNR